jgi:hypothetical protein
MRGRYVGIPRHGAQQGVVDGEVPDLDLGERRDARPIALREERTRRAVRAMAPGPCSGRMRSWYLPGSSGCSATTVPRLLADIRKRGNLNRPAERHGQADALEGRRVASATRRR